jgi:polar amino acid transport system permease protein
MMVWDSAYALSILPDLLSGLWITVQVTIAGSVLAVVLGLGFALARRSTHPLLAGPASWCSEFLRRTPLLVQLFFLFYVLPEAGILLPAFWAGVLGLGLHTSAYLAEVYRAGIQAVPKGQWEAARALNLTTTEMWRYVVLPQAIPPMIPTIGNYVVLMFKESALLSIITVPELMEVARNVGNDSYRYLEPITLAGLLYFSVSMLAIMTIRYAEQRLRVNVG